MNYYMPVVNVIGCGFAGIECALFLAGHGIKVHIFDQQVSHVCNCDRCTGKIKGERSLVCENLLKNELEFLGSPLIKEEERLVKEGYPGCKATKVLEYGKRLIRSKDNIEIFNARICQINPREINVIATGSNTDEKMFEFLSEKFGSMRLFRQRQVCPIVDNIDLSLCHKKGDNLYIPLDYSEYLTFVNSVIGQLNRLNIAYNHKFTRNTIEELAIQNKEAIRTYAMMPLYIENIARPYAVIRLHKQERGYIIEGISSKLDKRSQLEIFRSIRALRNVELVREADVLDAVFINSRFVINDFNQSLQDHNLFFAGEILGVNGYLGALASGLYTAMNVNNYVCGKRMVALPQDSLIGSLAKKITKTCIIKNNATAINYENYELIKNGEELSNPIYIDELFSRSFESLTRFKEVYTNGKYV